MTKDRGYSDDDMREVADNPEWTDAELATAKPLEKLLPQLGDALAAERSSRELSKSRITLTLDKAVVDNFRSTGKGWELRINAALKKAAGL